MNVYKQYKSQISNVCISAMEAATETKQNAIGSSQAVLQCSMNRHSAPSGPLFLKSYNYITYPWGQWVRANNTRNLLTSLLYIDVEML